MNKDKILECLDSLNIHHVTVTHEKAFTVEEQRTFIQDLLKSEPNVCMVKNLFLKSKKKPELILLTAHCDSTVDLKSLGAKIGVGSNLRFADENTLQTVLGVTKGSVTPLAIINDKEKKVTLLLDEAILGYDKLIAHPLSNDASTVILVGDMKRFFEHTGHEYQIINLNT
ncbi:prolyl-tRNA synthetase associated domain-containing protein [Acrasis kona]|uniref:Prolyl-tRNA synthetase associated domain-containing protein n=1 Tax=Acrasis kona TaxID=1008807 RepID=A0AAW2Z2I6_9EUKA